MIIVTFIFREKKKYRIFEKNTSLYLKDPWWWKNIPSNQFQNNFVLWISRCIKENAKHPNYLRI